MNTTTTILASLMLATATFGIATAGTVYQEKTCGEETTLSIAVDNRDDGGFVSGNWDCGGSNASCSDSAGFCSDTSNTETGYSSTTTCVGQAEHGNPSLSCSSYSSSTSGGGGGGGGGGETCDLETACRLSDNKIKSVTLPDTLEDALTHHANTGNALTIVINGADFGAVCQGTSCLPITPTCGIVDGLHTCSVSLA